MLSYRVGATCTATYSIPANNTNAIGASYTTSGWSNTVSISGTFTVNSDFTFSNCHILMDLGSSITIDAGKKLTLDNVHIEACTTYVWGGIDLPNSTNLGSYPLSLEVKGGSVIEDAFIAINVTGNNGIRVINSQINRCVQGIRIEDSAPNSTLEFYDSEITCYSSYNSPGTGTYLLSPFNGQRSYEGIVIIDNNTSINIGDPIQGQNFFDNLGSVAIGFQRTDCVVQNNQFDHCWDGIICTGYLTGSSSSNTYSATIGGSGDYEKNIFNNINDVGVLIYDSYNPIIYSNEFNDCSSIGIRFQNQVPYSVDLDIDGNIFFNTAIAAIDLQNAWNINDGQISNNHINDQDNLTFLNDYGIRVNSIGSITRNITIDNNDIWNCHRGIYAEYLQSNCVLVDNSISVPDAVPNTTYVGIDLLDCQKMKVLSNEVHRYDDDVSTHVIGIRGIDMTYDDKFSLNHLEDHNTTSMIGFYIRDNSVGAQLECNHMIDCNYAMRLGSSGGGPTTMSAQGDPSTATQNTWNASTNYQRIDAYTNQIDWYYNFNSVGTSWSNQYWPQTNSPDIFLYSITYSGSICSVPGVSNFAVSRDVDPIVFETISFDDDYDEYENDALYNSKASLFRTFIINHEDWMNAEEYDSWFDNLYDENIGKLVRAELIILNPSVENFESEFDDATELLSEFDPGNTIEENTISMLNIILGMKIAGNYSYNLALIDPEDVELIEEIACQNSIHGGKSVHWARELLHVEIDDEVGCSEERRGRFIQKNQNVSNIKLYPNPTTSTLQISGDESYYNIEIFDTKGSKIKQVNSIAPNTTINLELPIGLYSYRISSTSGNTTKNGKLSVVN